MRKDICKALSNETRAKIVSCLTKPKTVTQMLEECSLSQSALSQHLKILKDSEVVTTTKDGKNVFYKVANTKVSRIAKLLINY